MTRPLTASQRAALVHVRDRARAGTGAMRLARLGLQGETPRLLEALRRHGRVTLNFHPDRLRADGLSVAEALLEEGIYRSQFETGTSNGSRTAFPGGHRDLWEEAIFGGAYQAPGTLAAERPRYGGLNLMGYSDGACPRFGSCHLRLKSEVLDRCTFCFGDSYLGPADVGTLEAFEPVLAALFETVQATGVALGRPEMDLPRLVRALVEPEGPRGPGRSLDDYVEVQVHGEIRLDLDGDGLVLDPSFRGTPTERLLEDAAARYGLSVDWHEGFELPPEEVPPDFRGAAIPPLAARIREGFASQGEPVDAALIGRAAASVVTEPDLWLDRGTVDETLQHLKQLWHVLVRYGHPAGSSHRR